MNLSWSSPLVLMAFVSLAIGQTKESRTWTDAQGNMITGVFLNSTDDTVTIQRVPDGQAFRLKLADCAPEDRAYVAKIKADAREAESFDALVTGEITWRLPPWNSLGWTHKQPAELWIWDEKTKSPSEKVATLSVTYTNSSKRNEFFGTYKSVEPVRLWRLPKYVIKARFNANVNGEPKSIEQISTPMVLPSAGKDGINFSIVRFSLTR